MTPLRTHSRSPYMEFAKLNSGARYNLAGSGMASYPLSDLGIKLTDLEINGPNAYGYEPLNQAIARRYRVPADCVVAANGTAMANYLALAASANPGEEILIEEPTYPLLLDAARYLGFSIKRFQRSPVDFQINIADIEKNVSSSTKLIVLCNLHNPSGVLTPAGALKEIGTIAKRVNAKVLVDEVYLEMLWMAQPDSAFHIDPATFISTNSLTKAYGLSGLRCGWVLAAPELAERMRHLNDLHGSTPVHPGELLSVIAFSRLEQISAKQRTRLDENRKLLREALASQNQLEYCWPEFGTVVSPKLKQGSVSEFCERLRTDFEVSVVPGHFFEMPPHIRIGVGNDTEDVRRSLAQLQRALNS